MKPLVSIIIPTFNRANLIGETLDSVIAQTYENWECFVIDDGSTDETVKIVNLYVKKENRIKLLIRPSNRKKGASTCRNIGLENAKGEYIQFLDSDDIISNNKLSAQVKLLQNENSNCIATCKWGRFKRDINKDIELYENFDSYKSFDDIELFLNSLISSKGYFPIHSYLINHSLIKKIGKWNEILTLNDDGEFMMRVIADTDKICYSENGLAYYRWTNEDNLSSFNKLISVENAIISWIEINALLKKSIVKRKISYVEFVKGKLYINIKKSFPNLIIKYKSFFKTQIRSEKIFFKILRRLKIKFEKLNQK